MSGDDAGERTGFPCLATARYMVAAVVTVLAVVVVVMVTTVAFRPENIRLSIPQGYIQATDLWKARAATTEIAVRKTRAGDFELKASRDRGEPGEVEIGQIMDAGYYKPADEVEFQVSLSAQNPSGRADIHCDIIAVRLLDMPGAPSLTGMVYLGDFDKPDPFLVERESSHTMSPSATVNNTDALAYIARTYGGTTTFQAMLQVNVTVVSSITAAPSMSPKPGTLYCGPVTVSMYASDTAAEEVICKRSAEIGYPVPPASNPRPLSENARLPSYHDEQLN